MSEHDKYRNKHLSKADIKILLEGDGTAHLSPFGRGRPAQLYTGLLLSSCARRVAFAAAVVALRRCPPHRVRRTSFFFEGRRHGHEPLERRGAFTAKGGDFGRCIFP